jgi:hypothetical protein
VCVQSEQKEIEAAARRVNKSKSDWVRETLLQAARMGKATSEMNARGIYLGYGISSYIICSTGRTAV